ncbi:ricin-type beta-trefoil lectin protein [Chitinophaga skermanii]|uniref:Ricin-type beta-trefoil lectin protein n=1 Tax=Chitinophaga skermanii TaxID=331697 RepID=A0A327QNL1_9BACT|nr:RICIN domain-containing protein [Chitinophaga skermanii]RAJ05284.1 ricin-type beta-trefoil lectin protein [Chitinophaga skermanii]
MKKKFTLYVVLLMVGGIFSTNTLFAQISAQLEPYFERYTNFITSNKQDSIVLFAQRTKMVKDTARLKTRLAAAFSGKTFSHFNFLVVGGYGSNTPVRSSRGDEGSDLDLNLLFKINNGIAATISAYTFKEQVKQWLQLVFPNTANSTYQFEMKDPVVAIKADTTFPDGSNLVYHMDIGSFNQLNVPHNPACLPANLCSEMAWGRNSDNAVEDPATWNETASPGFVNSFNTKFPVTTVAGNKVLSVCKIFKFWNKTANYSATDDDIPPSLSYLVASYYWAPTYAAPPYRLQQLIAVVDSLRKNVFNNNCTNVAGATLNVPFYTSTNANLLNKMSETGLRTFCNSLQKLSDTLHFVAAQTSLPRALQALSNVLPYFNNAPAGTFKLVSVNSSQIVSPKNDGTGWGDTLVQYTNTSANTRKWTLGNIQLLPNGQTYYIISNAQSGLVIDNPYSSLTAGTPMTQYGYNNGDNQKWEITFIGYDASNRQIYQIKNKKSGLLLDVEYPWGTGARIIQWPSNGGDNQQWYLEQ